MDNKKIHPMLLLSIFINAIAMGILAFNHYMSKQNGLGLVILFMSLSFMFLIMTISGLIINNKGDRTKK
jgi:multidrug transporter EmrE-like cation transporter